jgi:AcrR family transcriptional regulator
MQSRIDKQRYLCVFLLEDLFAPYCARRPGKGPEPGGDRKPLSFLIARGLTCRRGKITRMVATPWGDSDTLRERRLPPGPATPADEVARNQRERLFAAMVASVADRGYPATRVADLVDLSGVSTRSFYALFSGKEDCLLATIDALLAATAQMLRSSAGRAGRPARAALGRTAELIAENRPLARICLIDSLASGPRAQERLAVAAAGFEALASEIAARRFPGAPPEIASTWVGGLQELARSRLLAGTEAGLPALFEQFASFFAGYEAPRASLRAPGRPLVPKAPSLEGHDHVDRAIRAFVAVLAEKGLAAASVEETLRRASMSATTFYSHFSGKGDVLLAAIDLGASEVLAATMTAARRSPEWGLSVRAGIGAFLSFLAFRPELASLLLVEYAPGGAAAMRRRAEALRPLESLFAGGARHRADAPPAAPEVAVACLLATARGQMLSGGAASLPRIAAPVTHLLLAPFLGTAAATEIANGDGQTRRGAAEIEAIRRLISEPLPSRILIALEKADLLATVIASRLGVPEREVEEELEGLLAAGAIEVVDDAAVTDRGRRFHSRMRLTWTSEWSDLEAPERAEVSGRILDVIRTELAQATRSGSFDARPDRHLIRFHAPLDERGWAELDALLDRTTEAIGVAFTDASARLTESGEQPIDGRAVLMLFEMPEHD